VNVDMRVLDRMAVHGSHNHDNSSLFSFSVESQHFLPYRDLPLSFWLCPSALSMMNSFISLSFIFSLCSLSVFALRIPFDVRVETPATHTNNHISRQSSSNGIVPVGNTQNLFYYTNITLGGQNISVMLDTGR